MSENNDLIVTKTNPLALRYEPTNLNELIRYAERIINAKLCPRGIEHPADVILMVQRGAKLGIDAATAIQSFHVIDGKVSLPADMMIGIAKSHPLCEYFVCLETTERCATWETKRRGNPTPEKLTYTIEQASKAELCGKKNWKKHPAEMLRAAAGRQLARMVYQDVLAGIYDPDELGAASTPDGQYIDAEYDAIDLSRPTREEREGTTQAGAADRLWGEVLEAVGKERALVWRGHYLEGLDEEELWDVETRKLDKMLSMIAKAKDRAAFIEECIQRAEAKQATEETPVEDTGKQLAAKADAAKEKRDEELKGGLLEEFNALLSCVDDATADKFIVVYVERVREANNNSVEVHTLADVDLRKIGAIVRKLRGMSDSARADYIDGVIADSLGTFEADDDEVSKAAEEQDNGRWLEANKTWWAAANEPFLRGVADLEEKQAKQLRKEAKIITEKFRAMQLDSWGVESSRELTIEEYEQKAQRLADIPVDAREEYIRDIIAKAD